MLLWPILLLGGQELSLQAHIEPPKFETTPSLVNSSPRAQRPSPTSLLPGEHTAKLPSDEQSFLLWPKELNQFVNDYESWPEWLGSTSASPFWVRDELLVAVNALAHLIPHLTVETDETQSDVVIVTGSSAALHTLLYRLHGHPLLARITEDTPAQRNEARAAWARRAYSLPQFVESLPLRQINIRNNWVTNLVWGYGRPNAAVTVTLTRNNMELESVVVVADLYGLYRAYFSWEIRAGDVVSVDDGVQKNIIAVIPLQVSFAGGTVQLAGPDRAVTEALTQTQRLPAPIRVTVGKIRLHPTIDDTGSVSTQAVEPQIPAGTPGFLQVASAEDSSIFMPFARPIIQVRRDTSYGPPFGSAHHHGISSIVWGSATPNSTLVVTLTRSSNIVVTRTVTSSQVGDFSISLDLTIEDGDLVQVFDGFELRTVRVPEMTVFANPETRVITGFAPVDITATEPDSPHSLRISFVDDSRQVTTTAAGAFRADFSSRSYLAGMLGAMRYITPAGDRVYKPIFVVEPFARGKLGDWWADTVLGQPDFTQITPNEVTNNRLFNSGGVYVDRRTRPNRVFVYDSGNSRVLGLLSLGMCVAGEKAGQACTTRSDCPNSTCLIQENKPADLVLGQPSFNSSTCNSDSGYQIYPEAPFADARTLCGLAEYQTSIWEGGSFATMATDAQGNLYVPDFFNNRVLLYRDPFLTDQIADAVWGQVDFSGTTCNQGAGLFTYANTATLCFTPETGAGEIAAGLDIDASGAMWVADNQNNRVLRFPFSPSLNRPSKEADLVLGQPDFTTITAGPALNQMNHPASVRVDKNGAVYVADSLNDRVLIFNSPFFNGMSASGAVEIYLPHGLEIDPEGSLWINGHDGSYWRSVRYRNGTLDIVVPMPEVGGIGIDSDGNVLVAGWATTGGVHFSAPSYQQDAYFLYTGDNDLFNSTGDRGLVGGTGLEVAAGQLIYSDHSRMLFWNQPWNLTNYQPADGVVGEPDFHSRKRWGPWFTRMRADDRGRLWVIYADIGGGAKVHAYQLPLKTGATPIITITAPVPVLGVGVLTWTEGLFISGVAIESDQDALWLSDRDNNRVFRIRDASTQPVVDVVLGQPNLESLECNHGRGKDFPSADSLCDPGALAFDLQGNLYVADHNVEVEGNWRLLEFDATSLPDAPSTAVYGIPATRVFGRNNDFSAPNCLGLEHDPMCGPLEPGFDSRGRMVIGFNAYLGPRFPMVYQDPLTRPYPVAALGDFYSGALAARFDQFDNFYTFDGNRNRILIYRRRAVQTYAVTGNTTTGSGAPLPGVLLETTGYAASGISNASGQFTIQGLVTGTYELVAQKDQYIFVPATRTLRVPPDLSEYNFVAYRVVQADFTASPTFGVSPLRVVFTNTSVGDFTQVHWDFGDGTSSNSANPTHQYTSAGVYTVSLTVQGPGGSDTKTRQELIYVVDPSTGGTIYLPAVQR